MSGYIATQNTRVFKEQLNSLSAEENSSSVTDGIPPPPKKPKLSLSQARKDAAAIEESYKHGTICLSGEDEAYNEARKGVLPVKRQG